MFIEKKKSLFKKFIVSVACNLILFFLIIFLFVYKRNLSFERVAPSIKKIEKLKIAEVDFIKSLENESFERLVSFLGSKEFYCGRKIRDLSLGILFSFYFIDVPRALGRDISKSHIYFSGKTLEIIENLSDKDFISIQNFIFRERYPYTLEGIFSIISSFLVSNQPIEEDLLVYFSNTKEFLFFRKLISLTDREVDLGFLMRMVINQGYTLFKNNFENEDSISIEKLRKALLSYVYSGERLATSLFLFLDWDYVFHCLTDDDILRFLSVINYDNINKDFVEKLCCAMRSEKVLLYSKNILENFSKKEFVEKEHVVVPGESLWVIAKHYQVRVEDLAKYNKLEKFTLSPGERLKIPR